MPSSTPGSPQLPPGLTPSQLSFWDENGYLIIPDVLAPETISSLLSETHRMLSTIDLSTHPMTKFTTGSSSPSSSSSSSSTSSSAAHISSTYFLASSSKISFFFEPTAFHPTTNALTKPIPQSINKIGHYLHYLSPSFRAITLTPYHASIARSLRFRDPRVLQSMVICKQPEIGGAVPPHQDSTFLFTEPPSAVGFWYALEDARRENGCLSFVGGSHRWKGIGKRFVRRMAGEGGEGEGTEFVRNEGSRFPKGVGSGVADAEGLNGGETNGVDGREKQQHEEQEYTLGEVKAGSLVLIHGNILHKSEANLSGKSRFIYTFHVIEGENEYDERNWLQPPPEGFTKLYE